MAITATRARGTMRRHILPLVLLVALPWLSAPAGAGELRAAVAANFTSAAREIGRLFTQTTGHRVVFSFGATGQLFAQIANGAPFDVFLSADQERAERAVAAGLAVPGTRFTYAIGRLALYSAAPDRVSGPEVLSDGDFHRLAIANPDTAPYGQAAIGALRALGAYERISPRIVRGNNAAQAFQFVQTGNAEIGIVALAHIAGHNGGSRWLVPTTLHSPIAQDAVLLLRGQDNAAAHAFLEFLNSAAAGAVKRRHGYQPPADAEDKR